MIARELAAKAPVDESDFRRVLRGLDGQADIPPLVDRRASLPKAIGALAMFSILIAAFTAGPAIDAGFASSDLVLLLALQLVTAAVVWRVRWQSISEPWLLAIIGFHVVLIAGLITLTGGSSSPFLALYAPLLALAGWYLQGTALVVALGLVASTEAWRALVVDPSGSDAPVAISLLVYGLVALLAWLASRWSTVAAVGSRRDQVRAAATLHAVRAIGLRGKDEPVEALAAIAGRALASSVWLAGTSSPAHDTWHACATDARHHVEMPVVAHGRSAGAIGFCRRQPLSTSELRLAAILASAVGQALEIRALRERCGEEDEAAPG